MLVSASWFLKLFGGIMKEQIEKFLTLEELSDLSGLTVKFLRRAKSDLGLPSYKFGKLVKVKESDFKNWSEQRRVKAG